MASPVATEKLASRVAAQYYDFDPGATTLTDIAWVDMRDFGVFLCSFIRTIGTSATVFKILANAASDGSGTDVIIKTHAVGSEPNALMDQIHLECTAEELAQEGADAGIALRYVTAQVSVATGTDEAVIAYIRSQPRWAYTGLTTDIVA